MTYNFTICCKSRVQNEKIPNSQNLDPIINLIRIRRLRQTARYINQTLTIDENMFATSQTYAVPLLGGLDGYILSFDFDCLNMDESVLAEYGRLNT